VCVGYIHGIAVFDVEKAVDVVVVAEAAGEGIEGTVLEDENDDVLDARFPVVGLIAICGLIVMVAVPGTGGDERGERERGDEGGVEHFERRSLLMVLKD
jgi:hypothetical protein